MQQDLAQRPRDILRYSSKDIPMGTVDKVQTVDGVICMRPKQHTHQLSNSVLQWLNVVILLENIFHLERIRLTELQISSLNFPFFTLHTVLLYFLYFPNSKSCSPTDLTDLSSACVVHSTFFIALIYILLCYYQFLSTSRCTYFCTLTPNKFPCTVCEFDVHSNHRAVFCDSCYKWACFHCTPFTSLECIATYE